MDLKKARELQKQIDRAATRRLSALQEIEQLTKEIERQESILNEADSTCYAAIVNLANMVITS